MTLGVTVYDSGILEGVSKKSITITYYYTNYYCIHTTRYNAYTVILDITNSSAIQGGIGGVGVRLSMLTLSSARTNTP